MTDRPIITDEEGQIVQGHHRYQAAVRAGITPPTEPAPANPGTEPLTSVHRAAPDYLRLDVLGETAVYFRDTYARRLIVQLLDATGLRTTFDSALGDAYAYRLGDAADLDDPDLDPDDREA